jgi:hypothetical protein
MFRTREVVIGLALGLLKRKCRLHLLETRCHFSHNTFTIFAQFIVCKKWWWWWWLRGRNTQLYWYYIKIVVFYRHLFVCLFIQRQTTRCITLKLPYCHGNIKNPTLFSPESNAGFRQILYRKQHCLFNNFRLPQTGITQSIIRWKQHKVTYAFDREHAVKARVIATDTGVRS